MINTIDNTGIKKTIIDTIPEWHLDKIILFGSRARNDFVAESDYDLLVILADRLTQQDKRKISSLLRKAFAKKWIQKADNDLQVAFNELNVTNSNIITDAICFHCQQAVEKYLKSFLISKQAKYGHILWIL